MTFAKPNILLGRQAEKLNALAIEHDDLDFVISALSSAGNCDDLLIRSFKKRKLQIKDEIACALTQAPAAQGAMARAS
jgi:hypothetical protein